MVFGKSDFKISEGSSPQSRNHSDKSHMICTIKPKALHNKRAVEVAEKRRAEVLVAGFSRAALDVNQQSRCKTFHAHVSESAIEHHSDGHPKRPHHCLVVPVEVAQRNIEVWLWT